MIGAASLAPSLAFCLSASSPAVTRVSGAEKRPRSPARCGRGRWMAGKPGGNVEGKATKKKSLRSQASSLRADDATRAAACSDTDARACFSFFPPPVSGLHQARPLPPTRPPGSPAGPAAVAVFRLPHCRGLSDESRGAL